VTGCYLYLSYCCMHVHLFQYNKFKVRILNEKVNTPTTTVYRCGPLIDLCRGPHVRHTGKVKSFKITKVSNIYP